MGCLGERPLEDVSNGCMPTGWGVAVGLLPGPVPQCVQSWAWASYNLFYPPPSCKVFSLPPSVLRCFAQEPSGTKGAYKAAVGSFLQQQHAPAQGKEGLSQPGTQDPQNPAVPPSAAQTEAQPPTAAQTEALSRLFDSVKTLTAKEELLQTLR